MAKLSVKEKIELQVQATMLKGMVADLSKESQDKFYELTDTIVHEIMAEKDKDLKFLKIISMTYAVLDISLKLNDQGF